MTKPSKRGVNMAAITLIIVVADITKHPLINTQ